MIRNDNKGEKVMDLETKKILMNDCTTMDLLSVGSFITKDLIVFPLDISEAPETASDAGEMSGVHIYDLTDEWYCKLSSDDLVDFFAFIELVNKDNMVMSVYNEWKTDIWSKWEDFNNCYMNLDLDTMAVA
tara:strand:+ start:143 stop:535 length:393 start_codon:yes stop_codon:yes gene_type:complete